MAETGGFDALVLAIDYESSALLELEFRLNSLRLALIDGNPEFIRRAADDADRAATAAAALGEPREAALARVVKELGLDPTTTVVAVANHAPTDQIELVERVVGDLLRRSRAVGSQRDAIRTLAGDGQRTLSRILDLGPKTEGELPIDLTSEPTSGTLFVGEF